LPGKSESSEWKLGRIEKIHE